jgi:hypothetical protein
MPSHEKETSGGRSAHRSCKVFALVCYFAMQVSAEQP